MGYKCRVLYRASGIKNGQLNFVSRGNKPFNIINIAENILHSSMIVPERASMEIIGCEYIDYYDVKGYLSNSELGGYKEEFFGVQQTEKQFITMQKAFYDGGLFDDSVTESVEVGFTTCLRFYNGKEVSLEDRIKTKRMIESLKSDREVWNIIERSSHQAEFYDDCFKFDCNGIKGKCRMKGKLDYLLPNFMASDLKSTACKTEKSFRNAITYFGYDRQGANYMDLSGVDRYMIFAVSKYNFELFKFAFDRKSDIYKRAKEKRDSLIFTSITNQ